MAQRSADSFVAFGITGNLAKEIIGVVADDWTLSDLRRRMRESIKHGIGKVDGVTFDRLAARLSCVHGDFADSATYERLAKALGSARSPVVYLETPPSLFATVVGGLATTGLAGNARVVIEKPFGHDLASAKALAAELHRSIGEQQIFRVDHFLGKLGLQELLYLRHANAMLAPLWSREHVSSVQITMAESFGIEDRGRFYDAVDALRDVVVNHLLQLLAAAAMERRATAKRSMLRATACSSPSPTPIHPATCAASTPATAAPRASPGARRPRRMRPSSCGSTTSAGGASHSSSARASTSRSRRPSSA